MRLCGAAVLSCAFALMPDPLQSARANGDTRSISMIHNHTGEHIDIVFKRDGRFDRDALQKLNWFLRDWRKQESIEMDARLLDLLWEVYADLGATAPVHIICGYRSEGTNNMLRARSSGVALHSQHTQGRAMDIAIPGIPTARLREMGMLRQKGGVGFYPTSGTPFVHLDVGSVRAWPRMNTRELVRLFPSGETLHLPSDGPPLPGYNIALAKFGRDGKSGDTLLAYTDSGRGSLRPEISAALTRVAALAPVAQPPVVPVKQTVPVPLARPAALVQVASLKNGPVPENNSSDVTASIPSRIQTAQLTALRYDAHATAEFVSTATIMSEAELTAPQMNLASVYFEPPVDTSKGFGLRGLIKADNNDSKTIDVAQKGL